MQATVLEGFGAGDRGLYPGGCGATTCHGTEHCAWASLVAGRNADNDMKSAEMVHARYE